MVSTEYIAHHSQGGVGVLVSTISVGRTCIEEAQTIRVHVVDRCLSILQKLSDAVYVSVLHTDKDWGIVRDDVTGLYGNVECALAKAEGGIESSHHKADPRGGEVSNVSSCLAAVTSTSLLAAHDEAREITGQVVAGKEEVA